MRVKSLSDTNLNEIIKFSEEQQNQLNDYELTHSSTLLQQNEDLFNDYSTSSLLMNPNSSSNNAAYLASGSNVAVNQNKQQQQNDVNKLNQKLKENEGKLNKLSESNQQLLNKLYCFYNALKVKISEQV